MRVPFSIQITIPVITGISLFWFPWTVSLLLMFCSALIFPPAAMAFGIAADILYYPGIGVPVSTVSGALITLIAVAVRYFVKTRIM